MERTANELYQKLDSLKKENTNLDFEFFEEQNHGDGEQVSRAGKTRFHDFREGRALPRGLQGGDG